MEDIPPLYQNVDSREVEPIRTSVVHSVCRFARHLTNWTLACPLSRGCLSEGLIHYAAASPPDVAAFSEAFQVGNSWTNYGKNYCLQNAQDRFCAAEKAAAAVLP